MITNDRQYKIAKSQVENFSQALSELMFSTSTIQNIHPKLLVAQKNAIESKMNELIAEVKEYEKLKEGKIAITEVNSIADLPMALIKARIANGMTQADLAEKVGVKMQQIQRYEAEIYETASLKTLIRIAEHMQIKLNGEVQIKNVEAPENLDVKNYPFKQMFSRKWFGNFIGSYNDAVIDSKNLIEKLFESAGLDKLQNTLTKKSIRTGSTLNMFALNAWYARILIKAKAQTVSGNYNKNTITESWLKGLAELSTQNDSPLKAAEYLRNSGIRFIVEPPLEGTFLDGAALLWENNEPVVAMTLRHDRLDNFWFVLFHELAHIRLHLSDNVTAIFDDLDIKKDGIEKEADDFSLNALIPEEVWRKSLVRFSASTETIVNQAKTLKIHPALVAGRIRRQTGQYFLFSDLIGQGQVRLNFSTEYKN